MKHFLAPLVRVVFTSAFVSMALGQTDEELRRTEPRTFDCAVRLRGFVTELDEVLASARTVFVVHDLFKKYLPLEKCDIQEAITISRQSKYFQDCR